MRELQVGDRVRIQPKGTLKDIKERYRYDPGWVESMENDLGEIGVVTHVWDDGENGPQADVETDNDKWTWYVEDLVLVEEEDDQPFGIDLTRELDEWEKDECDCDVSLTTEQVNNLRFHSFVLGVASVGMDMLHFGDTMNAHRIFSSVIGMLEDHAGDYADNEEVS